MATPAYVPLDPNAPSGTTQAPPAYSASDLANIRALRDAMISGLGLAGHYFAQVPAGTSIPQDYFFGTASNSLVFRARLTYAGVPHYQPATLQWAWSNDGAATYQNIGPLVNFTFDAATGTITNASDMPGPFMLFIINRARGIWNWMRIDAHTAITTGAHGTGTMALQNKNAVDITGGVAQNLTVLQSVIGTAVRIYPWPPQQIPNGGVWNWQTNSGVQYVSFGGWSIANLAAVQPGEIKRIWVASAGALAIGSGGGITFRWAVGHPVWGAGAFGTLVSCVALDANNVLGTTTPIA